MESHEQSSCYIVGNWEKYRSREWQEEKKISEENIVREMEYLMKYYLGCN